jgi:UDPglucose 6-dehydrogenase
MEMNGAPPESFDVASNPEFLREGTAVADFLYPDRIVIGADNPRCLERLAEIYEPLTSGTYYKKDDAVPGPESASIPARLISTSAKSAELIKHASNAFLAMKISFINAVSIICEAVGADIEQLREGIGSDSRIGPRFLNAGLGYGGSCFPKDVSAFREVARECGYDFQLLAEVMRINNEQRARFVRKVRSALWTLKGKRLGALGLAFKGGTDDIRESPAIAVVQQLAQEDCSIRAYDPSAMERVAKGGLLQQVELAKSPYEAAKDADALLILTDWDEFGLLDLPRVRSLMKYPLIIDGRNLFSPHVMEEHGFTYVSVGRPDIRTRPARANVSKT